MTGVLTIANCRHDVVFLASVGYIAVFLTRFRSLFHLFIPAGLFDDPPFVCFWHITIDCSLKLEDMFSLAEGVKKTQKKIKHIGKGKGKKDHGEESGEDEEEEEKKRREPKEKMKTKKRQKKMQN